MNENPRDESDDDLRLLFQRTGPLQEPVDVQELLASTSSDTHRSSEDGQQLKSKIGWRTAAFIAIAASLALLLAIPFASTDSHAFAQVKEQVERLRTVDYVETQYFEDMPDGWYEETFGTHEKAQPSLEQKIASLESRLADADDVDHGDIQLRLSLLKALLGKDRKLLPISIRRIRIKGKHLERTDSIFPYGQGHNVQDVKTNTVAMFDHERKSKRIVKQAVTLSEAEETKEAVNVSPATDFFQSFRKIPTDATERLPKRTIAGKDAIGFRSVQEEYGGIWTTIYWVDATSNLPIRIDKEFDPVKDEQLTIRWVMDHFVFDAELDDAVFSTETPAGYSESQGATAVQFLAIPAKPNTNP